MKDERTPLQIYQYSLTTALHLAPYGWRWTGKGMIFVRSGKTFDLSAADIEQHERIFEEDHFRI